MNAKPIQHLSALACFVLTLAYQSHATVWTVSNHPISIAQFTTMLAAHNAASAGDTIYVHPSEVLYVGLSVTKQLTFLGPGCKPQSPWGLMAEVSAVTFQPGSDGSVISGFKVQNVQIFTATVTGIIIEKNRVGFINLQGAAPAISNITVRNNLIVGGAGIISSSSNPLINCHISNNLMYGEMGFMGDIAGSVGNTFVNNIIDALGTPNPVRRLENFTLAHNIIWGGADSGPMLWCELSHNIFFGAYTLVGLMGTGTSEMGNLLGVSADPLFAESTLLGFNYMNYAPAAPYPDLHLQPGSPAVGMAQGGDDIGIYAGEYPWLDNSAEAGKWTYYPPARLPEIITQTSPGSTGVDQPVQVTITGKHAN